MDQTTKDYCEYHDSYATDNLVCECLLTWEDLDNDD